MASREDIADVRSRSGPEGKLGGLARGTMEWSYKRKGRGVSPGLEDDLMCPLIGLRSLV